MTAPALTCVSSALFGRRYFQVIRYLVPACDIGRLALDRALFLFGAHHAVQRHTAVDGHDFDIVSVGR